MRRYCASSNATDSFTSPAHLIQASEATQKPSLIPTRVVCYQWLRPWCQVVLFWKCRDIYWVCVQESITMTTGLFHVYFSDTASFEEFSLYNHFTLFSVNFKFQEKINTCLDYVSLCLDMCLWYWSVYFFHFLDWSVALRRLGSLETAFNSDHKFNNSFLL